MSNKSSRYCLYREFVDAYMKGHPEMTRCTSHHSAQTEWNQIKRDEELVRKKITEYLDLWNKAGSPSIEPKKSTQTNGKKGGQKRNGRKRSHSSEDEDPSYDPDFVESETPTFSKRKNQTIDEDEMDPETLAKEKPWVARSKEKAAKKKAQAEAKAAEKAEMNKTKTPAQEAVLKDLQEISERIANLIQVKSMGLLTPENQKTLKKLIEQKKQRTTDLKRLQSKQRASTRYRERKKRRVEQLCATNPEVAAELSKIFRPSNMRMQIEEDCPDLLQIIAEIARVGGATDSKGKACASLDDLKDKIKERGYEIRKSSLYYRLMPSRAISHDGKKHVVTVPVRLRKLHDTMAPKHEDCHFTTAALRHIKDLAGIFGQDCVFYLTQDTKSRVSIGRPAAKGQAPLIMHLDYEQSSSVSQTIPTSTRHQITPCVYAASLIDDTGLITYAGPTYISLRSAKHDRITHETHSTDFDRLVRLKEFEKFSCDHLGRVKPIVVMNVDTVDSENNARYLQTLSKAIETFKKYNLDCLFIMNQAPGQALFNVVERRLAPLSHDLAGLILPHDHFGTHLNDAGLTEHAELEKINFKATADVLAEVWSMNVLDEYPVVTEYINPSPLIDDQLKMVDSRLTLDNIIDRLCIEEENVESIPLDQRLSQSHSTSTIPTTEMKIEYDIDEYWCATHVLQTEYTIQIIRCNNPPCCTPWRSNYIQVFPHRFLPPPVPFNRSSRGVKMAEIEASSATTNPVSPFYGNLFQRIQFHGIVINRTHNDLLPYDACCPSLQTKLHLRICSICKQYIPSSIRLRNHYKIHQQQYASNFLDYNNNKEEDFVDDNDLIDPYEMSMLQIQPTQTGVCLFTDMIEWLRSEFEDDPVVDTKVKSTAATASAMIRKDKQMAAAVAACQTTTVQEEKSVSITKQQITTTINTYSNVDSLTENGSMLDAMEQLAVLDDSVCSNGTAPSQQSWDELEDLIEKI